MRGWLRTLRSVSARPSGPIYHRRARRGGVRRPGRRSKSLRAQCGALLATTLPAKGLFDGNEFAIGIAGGFASELAYELFADSDLVIAVGASLSQSHRPRRQALSQGVRGADRPQSGLAAYGVGAADLSLKCDAKAGLEAILDQLRQDGAPTTGFHSAALARRIATEKHDPREYPIEPGTFDPRDVIAELDRVIPKDWDVVTGAGHASYFTTLMRGRSPRNYFTLREFGAVGNGLSYALGVAAVRPEGKVLLLEGDGGLLMHIQELETIKRHKLKLVIGIMNDGGYGAEVHKFRADGLDPAEAIFGRPDFAAIAKGFGLRSANITSLDQFASLLRGYEAAGAAEVWDIPISDRVPSLYQLGAAQSPSLERSRQCFGESAHMSKRPKIRHLAIVTLDPGAAGEILRADLRHDAPDGRAGRARQQGGLHDRRLHHARAAGEQGRGQAVRGSTISAGMSTDQDEIARRLTTAGVRAPAKRPADRPYAETRGT